MNVEARFKALLKIGYPTEFLDKTIPVFAHRTEEERQNDKYDKDFEFVDRYTGLFAFANILLGHGGGEGLYRTINSALLSHLDRAAANTVLDIGCGVGRTLYDCAHLFPETMFVGMDYAYNMCSRTQQILLSGEEISLADSLSPSGFDPEDLVFRDSKKAENVFVAQGSVFDLPFSDESFDCVVNTYLIDRVEQPRSAIAEMIRVLKPGGLFVLSDPLNFEKGDPQKSMPTTATLVEVITSYGVDIIEHFDNLVYREVKDSRGNYNDFMSFVGIGRKRITSSSSVARPLDSTTEKIRHFERLASTLEPTATERAVVRQKVVNYSEGFLNRIEEEKAYNADPDNGKGLLKSPITDAPANIDELIELLKKNVDSPGLNPASGGHLGYIPGGGLYYSALGDFLADIFNRYAGLFTTGPGAVRMENMLIRWMAELVGFPENAAGNLTTGGSLAHLTAIVTARDAKDIRRKDLGRPVVYLSKQRHKSLDKALRIAGLLAKEPPREDEDNFPWQCLVREIPIDENCRMIPDELAEQIEADKKIGLNPFLAVATAGTTDVGAVDPLKAIGEICRKEGLWYHVDAAYGGFFILTEDGKKKLRGIELADSVTMDPHKGLFLPYGLGVILVRDQQALHNSFYQEATYIEPAKADEEPSPRDYSPELTKHFRGLRLWLPLKLHGVDPFRAGLEEKLLLAKYFHRRIKELGFHVGPEPDLSVVYYRCVPEALVGDLERQDEFNKDLLKEVNADGRVYISHATVDERYVLRFACLSFRTHLEHVEKLLEVLDTTRDKLLATKYRASI